MTKPDMLKALFELDKRNGFIEVESIDELPEEEREHLEQEAGSYMCESPEDYPNELRELLEERNLIAKY